MKFLEAFEGGFTSPKGDLVEFRSSTSQPHSLQKDEIRRSYDSSPASGVRGNYWSTREKGAAFVRTRMCLASGFIGFKLGGLRVQINVLA